MIPTYTYNIKENIITNYLGSNLAICLINNANLAITDTPNAQQLEARKNFTAVDLFTYEIGSTALNGYRRYLVQPAEIVPTQVTLDQTEAEVSVSFTADGGNFEQFTHIVALRGASITGADPLLNGNNRGDTSGTIIFVEPVDNGGLPLVLTDGLTFNYTFKLVSAAEII